MNDCKEVVAREPVSHEIMMFATRLSSVGSELADRVEKTLAPVVRASSPKPECGQIKESREYPPMFEDLRNSLYRIERAMNGISDTLDRAEL